ncbi:hemolysin family protein [Ammoniphilus sp. CFH 90114]|uniref:hemolysin family protein n=1 Tax=Ammoniphilus sp. CFH 90114 TaxID=2493665 RepID=UPI00100DCDF2|nr:hemolysin family protein [Ammoniphilus sp. CFH 90114]RXT07915.1 HlyC/CorC family transporter [Ammoniphilus sp. CFH 90114]
MSVEIIILVFLIILNAFFAASEIALISLNDNKVKMLAEAGDKKAKLLQSLLEEPSRFLATIQVGITLAGFLASAFAAGSFAGSLANFLYNMGVPLSTQWLETISVVIITLILSYFTLVLGELVPKRIAMQKAEPIAMFVVQPLTILSKITSPFVKLLTYSTNGMVRLFGIDPHANDEQVTEEEIRMMVDVGEERGVIQIAEKMMINNIFEFDNTMVSDIMTHRTNLFALSLEMTFDEIMRLANREKYTRFPVYEDHVDNIVGILHTKDLLQFIEERKGEEEFSFKSIIRHPYFVPSSRKASDLLKDFQKNKVHMAVVIDEYGGTAGIVTVEDLIEEIVGNIFDEHDEDESEVIRVDENTFILNGTLSLHDVERILDIDFKTDEFDTLSGYLIGQIGSLPNVQKDMSIHFEGHIFTVEDADDKRITKVKVTRTEISE